MKHSNTSERLKQLMKERNLRQIDILNLAAPFCLKYGVKMTKSDLSQYCSGKTEPYQDKLFILGCTLNVSEAWLMGYDVSIERQHTNISALSTVSQKTECNTIDESNLILNYRLLSSFSKKKVTTYVNNLVSMEKAESDILY